MKNGLNRLAVAVLVLAAPASAQQPPWLDDPFPSRYQAPAATDLLIRDATVLDGAGGRIERGDVLVRDGKIAAVGANLPNPDGVREIDAEGRWVTPGLIDIHSHNGTHVLPLTTIDHDASDVSELSDPNAAGTWIGTAVNPQDTAFSRALASGVTTLQILPGSTPIFGGRSVVVKPIPAATVAAMRVPGAAPAIKMACGENPKQYGADKDNEGPTSREGVVTYMRNAFLDARRYLDAWRRFAAGDAPAPERDLERETLAGVLAGDIAIHAHCYRANDMAVMLAIADEFDFEIAAFHHATEAYKIPALLREAGTCAAVWADWWGFKMEALDAARANAPLLERADTCVVMHSDSPASGQRLNIGAAKAAAAGRRIGIDVPPETMIEWTTSGPARLLGLGDRIGTIAPGYEADIVLWSSNPFSVYSKADLVLIGGGVLHDRSDPPDLPVSDFELGRAAVMRP